MRSRGVPTPEELSRTVRALVTTLGPRVQDVESRPQGTVRPPVPDATSIVAQEFGALGALGAATGARLKLGKTLGEGGMGVVHLAVQESVGREIAVKTLRADAGDPEAAMRLLREAWVTGMLEHPNVVPVYDVGVDAAGRPQILLKRIEGVEWAALIRDPALAKQHAGTSDVREWHLRVFLHVCNAAHFAHSRGILHRDLKPENVMIGQFGAVYLVDWGIAVALRADLGRRIPLASEATEMAGTPAYMAPEMLGGDPPRLGVETDVYLLGATLFEVLTGRAPHAGGDISALVSSILLSQPAMPPGMPADLALICTRAMAADPEDRFPSADAVRLAVERYLEHRGSVRLTERAQERLGRLLEEIDESTTTGADSPRLHELYRECRFGFTAALEVWPENEAARGGLRVAATRLARHHLDRGEPEAAGALLAEIDAPPADLHAAVQEALARRHAESERAMALGRDLDPRTGARTRTFAILLLGVLWTGAPLVRHLRGLSPSHGAGLLTSLLLVAAMTALVVVNARALKTTAVNRRVFGSVAFVMAAPLPIRGFAWLTDTDPVTSFTFHFVLWFGAVGLMAIHVERRFALGAAAYLLGLLGAMAMPARIFLWAAIGHFVLVVNAVWIWAPYLGWRARRRHEVPPAIS